jgi:hypothetical protein
MEDKYLTRSFPVLNAGVLSSKLQYLILHNNQTFINHYIQTLEYYQEPKMSKKCVHKGCGKSFTDTEGDCQYHPGPPVFHEGQKGVWAPSSITSLSHQPIADIEVQDGNAAKLAF